MSLKRLTFSKPETAPKRKIEYHDLRVAFERVLEGKLGKNIPVRVKNVKGSVIIATTPSAPYRAEIIANSKEIIEEINNLLNCNDCAKKILVYFE